LNTSSHDLSGRIDRQGFALLPGVIENARCDALIDSVGALEAHAAVREKSGSTYAVRRVADLVPAVAELSNSPEVRSLIESILGPGARVVRSLLFDKTADANWKVPWHQDLTIAVAQRRDVAGFGPWSIKARVPHVQPPVNFLESMLTLRLHLDACGTENGPLRVLPASHRAGVLNSAAIANLRQNTPEVVCTMNRGDALLMRPLLLHASSPATLPAHRRIIHLEFAKDQLPAGLRWGES
jgi:hypothetical protein